MKSYSGFLSFVKKIVLGCYRKFKRAIKKSICFIIIYIKYNKKLKALKNIHKGSRCFIIGNGPSLLMTDLDKLKNEYTFASNKIFLAFEDTEWRPTYYCVLDTKLILHEYESIIKETEASIKFMSGNGFIIKKGFLPDWLYFYLKLKRFYPNKPLFSENISKVIYEGYTVTYANIQLAVYMGFKEIYLLGVDNTYSLSKYHDGTITRKEIKNHFSDKYMKNLEFGIQTNLPRLDYTTLAYQAAKDYTDSHGIKILNATRGGELEVFERVDLDSLI